MKFETNVVYAGRSKDSTAVAALKQAKYEMSFSSGCVVTSCVCMLCSIKNYIISINDVSRFDSRSSKCF